MSEEFKDLFSKQAKDYARFRPSYPGAMFDWLAVQAMQRTMAVDLGCGNGQATAALAKRFSAVVGVEPSQAQLKGAPRLRNIKYICAPAEATGLPSADADLLTVAQALHWFKPAQAFEEMDRVLKPGGVAAFWCYGSNKISAPVDKAVRVLYHDHLDAYWDPARRLVEDGYRSIQVPPDWVEIKAPKFSMSSQWTLEQLVGYLSTWSPLPRFQAERGFNALEAVMPELEHAWGKAEKRVVDWPLSMRVFRR